MNDCMLTRNEREAINGGRWFSSLSPTLRHDILRRARVRRYADGALMAVRGESASGWIACARGAIRVCGTTLTGKETTLDYVEPGQWLGEIALLDGGPRTHDACAHGETTVLHLAQPDFQAILADHTELYEALLREFALRTRRLYEQVEDLKTLDLRARLAKQLLALAARYGITDGHHIRITLRLAQQELAQLLGASRQRINEQLKRLERQDTIRMDDGALIVCDEALLRRMGEAIA